MTRTTRWMLILCFIAASIAVAWDFTPLTAGRDKGKEIAPQLALRRNKQAREKALTNQLSKKRKRSSRITDQRS